VSCDDFSDCHDEIAVADIDFIDRRPICGLYLQASGSPYEDDDTRSSIASSMVAERKSRSGGYEFVSYVIPDDATVDILSAI
jgi:hypothetical protein